MVDIPTQIEMTPEEANERLQRWYQKQAQLKSLRAHEHLERRALSDYYFHNPVEGTNRFDIGGGFDLKLQHGYHYKVSEEDLDQVKASDIKRLKLPWDDLFVYKPEVKLSVYRKLSDEQKAFVDGILDIKESSPQLSIVPQADRSGQKAHAQAASQQTQTPAPEHPAPEQAEPEAQAEPEHLPIILKAEDAEPGHHYNDGEVWWLLNKDGEWDPVEDGEVLVALNDKLLAMEPAQAPAKPKRKARKKAAKKATE